MKDAAIKKAVGRRLRKARKASGLTLREIEVLTGLHSSAIWRLEVGRSAPGLCALIRLCRSYKCSSDSILDLP